MTSKQKANLRKWVAALESGEYKQSRAKLKGQRGYCCLGVWCEVRKGGAWDGEIFTYNDVRTLPGNLTPVLRQELGISGKEEDAYIKLNDSSKRNFRYIAERIRKRHPEAFPA